MLYFQMTVLYGNQKISFPCTLGQKRIPWIQLHKPHTVEIVSDSGNKETIKLTDSISQKGKKIITGFISMAGYSIAIVFSYGIDPSRPSFAGTITVKQLKRNMRAA